MNLYPAIDILDGNAVRLVKGDFDARKVYDEDPLAAARGWTDAGARYLHVVDLDGAKSGAPVNLDHLRRIGRTRVSCSWGRAEGTQDIAAALAAGVTRDLGTAATEPALVGAERHGAKRVMVSVDVRGGLITTRGWTEHRHRTEQVIATCRSAA
jgi:phosphoribosylformimino-5-aminoimidazole carboxamide ribotide isomerase